MIADARIMGTCSSTHLEQANPTHTPRTKPTPRHKQQPPSYRVLAL